MLNTDSNTWTTGEKNGIIALNIVLQSIFDLRAAITVRASRNYGFIDTDTMGRLDVTFMFLFVVVGAIFFYRWGSVIRMAVVYVGCYNKTRPKDIKLRRRTYKFKAVYRKEPFRLMRNYERTKYKVSKKNKSNFTKNRSKTITPLLRAIRTNDKTSTLLRETSYARTQSTSRLSINNVI